MKVTEKLIQRTVKDIRMSRPEWPEWPVAEALRHAVRGNYAGCDDAYTFPACAVYVATRAQRSAVKSMEWPEHWREAMELLAAEYE